MNTTFVDTRLIRSIGELQPRTKGIKNLALAQLYCWGLNREKFGHPIEVSFYRQQADIGSRQTIYDHLELLRAKGLVQKSDAEKWTVCPDSQNRLSEVWDDLSKKLASGVRKPDNTKENNPYKNLLREAGQEVLKTWNSHAIRKSYLKKRNALLAEDNTALATRMDQFPDVDVARVLDQYLKVFPDLLVKRAKESGRPWSLKQVLNFPTFSEKLDELRTTCSSANPDQPDTLKGDPWLDHQIQHPDYWPPNALQQRDPNLPLGLKKGVFDEAKEAAARRHYHHPERPKK